MAQALSSTFNGIIGGTGLYRLPGLEPVARLDVETPWGRPSSAITIAKSRTGMSVAFVSRHGENHQFLPSEVPFQANIAALKHMGVEVILAFSAVGSLKQHIKPRDFVVPTQIIDRTKGVRPSTFFESGMVAHVGFGDPFDQSLADLVGSHKQALQGDGVTLHTSDPDGKDLTLICMEGPAFSTRAESDLYRSWGGSVINMSALPEAKLAREAEIAYSMVCMSTDYDSWRRDEEAVTVDKIVGNLKANSSNAGLLIEAVLPDLEKRLRDGTIGQTYRGSMKYAISTAGAGQNSQVKAKLSYLMPEYFLSDLSN